MKAHCINQVKFLLRQQDERVLSGQPYHNIIELLHETAKDYYEVQVELVRICMDRNDRESAVYWIKQYSLRSEDVGSALWDQLINELGKCDGKCRTSTLESAEPEQVFCTKFEYFWILSQS